MPDDTPIQHTPAHLAEDADVFDPRHPAASAFAVAQPGAGVVANDVDERGQNLTGAPTADEASREYADQKEVLARQHVENLKAANPSPDVASLSQAADKGEGDDKGGDKPAASSATTSGKKAPPTSPSTPPRA